MPDPDAPDNDTAQASEKTRREAVAVALKYIQEHDNAPRVVAGGRGTVAEQILQIAFAQGVKVREDTDLAELLSAIDIDSEIPLEAFVAVAEILAYVYRANNTLHLYTGENAKDGKAGEEGATP